jgi:lactate dehydrogenase-like 2-hydroxyacid dehydrogenase
MSDNAPAGKPKILVTRRFPEAVLARAARDYEATFHDDSKGLLSGGALIAACEGKDGLFFSPTEKLTAEVITALPESVRVAATFSVGVDHVDLEAAKARGLKVGNTPDVLTDATADIALLLMLGAARRAYEGERMVREARWYGWSPTEMLGIHMSGKRLGILGMGRIGQAVARRARGFDMEIHYHNRSRLSPGLEEGATYHKSPEDLLRVSEFLSINAPATKENHHFLDARRIALLPEKAVVVNTARGTLVKDEDLIEALKSGRIAAAGLDVFEGEPKINPAYRDLSNCFLLPHMGSATEETRDAMGFKALDNLDAFFAGKPLPAGVA